MPSVFSYFITTTILSGTWLGCMVRNLEAIKGFQNGILLARPAAALVPVSWILSCARQLVTLSRCGNTPFPGPERSGLKS